MCAICGKDDNQNNMLNMDGCHAHQDCHEKIHDSIMDEDNKTDIWMLYPEYMKIFDRDLEATKQVKDTIEAIQLGLINVNSIIFRCNLLRAQYERKKAAIQLRRYQQDAENARTTESKHMTDTQITEYAYMIKDKLTKTNQGKIDIDIMRYHLEKDYKVRLSMHKAEAIRKRLELEYPDEFQVTQRKPEKE
jgi:uncharacterized small protein (DUF1192 family)